MFRAVTPETEELRCCDKPSGRARHPHWTGGVVTWLGDAAHPVLPHTGQGTAQAIADAVALGQALTEGVNVADALQVY